MDQLPPNDRPPAAPTDLLLALAAIAETIALTCDSPKIRTTAALSALFARYLMDLGHRRWRRLRSGCRRALGAGRRGS